MSATVAALAAVGGGLGALGWEPLEPRLIARSQGSDELLEQPRWTRRITSRPLLMLRLGARLRRGRAGASARRAS